MNKDYVYIGIVGPRKNSHVINASNGACLVSLMTEYWDDFLKKSKGEIMDILKQVGELKEFLGRVYCFLEDNEDRLEGVDELEEIKMKAWDWQQELAKFLPEI